MWQFVEKWFHTQSKQICLVVWQISHIRSSIYECFMNRPFVCKLWPKASGSTSKVVWRLKRFPTRAGSSRKPRAGCASPSSSGSGRRTSSRALWARPGCSWPSRSCPAPAGATGTRFSLADGRLSRAAAPRRSQGNCRAQARAISIQRVWDA